MSLHTKLYLPTSRRFVIVLNPKTNHLKNCVFFFGDRYHTSFQYSKLNGHSVISTSQVRASAILLLLIIRNK